VTQAMAGSCESRRMLRCRQLNATRTSTRDRCASRNGAENCEGRAVAIARTSKPFRCAETPKNTRSRRQARKERTVCSVGEAEIDRSPSICWQAAHGADRLSNAVFERVADARSVVQLGPVGTARDARYRESTYFPRHERTDGSPNRTKSARRNEIVCKLRPRSSERWTWAITYQTSPRPERWSALCASRGHLVV
jgi:hypothetical protein